MAKDDLSPGNHPVNRVGHQGLFYEHLDGGDGLTVGVIGLYHNRNRWYSPALGRFTSLDPNATALPIITALVINGEAGLIVASGFSAAGHFRDGMNLYQYLGSNAVNRRDPLGQGLLMDFLWSLDKRVGLTTASAAAAMTGYRWFQSIVDALSFRSQMITGLLNTAAKMGTQRGADFMNRANQVMQGTSGRNFTVNNYRASYQWLVYGYTRFLPSIVDVHHIFPKGGPLGGWFLRRGIDPNNPLFLTEWMRAGHAPAVAAYQAAWTRFMTRNPDATITQIFQRARELAAEFGFETLF